MGRSREDWDRKRGGGGAAHHSASETTCHTYPRDLHASMSIVFLWKSVDMEAFIILSLWPGLEDPEFLLYRKVFRKIISCFSPPHPRLTTTNPFSISVSSVWGFCVCSWFRILSYHKGFRKHKLSGSPAAEVHQSGSSLMRPHHVLEPEEAQFVGSVEPSCSLTRTLSCCPRSRKLG